MKSNVTKKITLELTLDSSEMVMFTRGGKHTTKIMGSKLIPGCKEDVEIEISIQMDRKEQGRFDFIAGSVKGF